ncbi:hypothetical protein PIB30_043305 [Stylosanthes scabra]|uniref:RNase H type-1 domain-containing protein n=1 Tax=Stylosanthes scabra TaxID=79078 RepID=A0ABU6ZE92_9FABA|nr:hypothetical protein [Stylosanthes scabra]
MAPPSPWKDKDVISWNKSHDGSFSLKSAYNFLVQHHEPPDQEWILKNLAPKDEWPCVFGVAISSLWYFRNLFIFESKVITPHAAANMIKAHYSDILNSLSHRVLSNHSNSSSVRLICWNPPPEHFAKLNVDGSFYSHNNNAACGAVKFVQDGCHTAHPCFSFVEDIKILVRRFNSVSWSHTLREGNHVADSLAKRGQSLPTGLHLFDFPHLII